MEQSQVAAVLAKSYARALLEGPEPARLAYTGRDGAPRVVPVGFWVERERILIGTVPNSAKVAALRADPRVALTIDSGVFPPKALLVRGTAAVATVAGVPEGYLWSGRKLMAAEQYEDWAAGVRGLYDTMVVLTVTPTWAKLLDFETTIPTAVEDLVREKSRGR